MEKFFQGSGIWIAAGVLAAVFVVFFLKSMFRDTSPPGKKPPVDPRPGD